MKNICRVSAPMQNIRSFISVLTERKPSNTVIVTGKKVISTVTSTLLQIV